jgi:hypothetical protein
MLSLGLIAFVLFFSASCIPEFKNPLPVPKGVKPDQEILGTWESWESDPNSKDESFQITFFPAKSGGMYIVWTNIEGPEYDPDISILQGYTTVLNKDKFLCIRPIKKINRDSEDEQGGQSFVIANYRISDDTLLIYVFSQYSIKRLIEKGKLKGEIKERSFSDEVTVTSSSEELAAAIIKEGVENFIVDDEGDYVGMKFKKLKKWKYQKP